MRLQAERNVASTATLGLAKPKFVQFSDPEEEDDHIQQASVSVRVCEMDKVLGKVKFLKGYEHQG